VVLGYLHKTNILYRDLKPENVLMGNDGYLLLADFGLAKRLQNQKDETETFCGTPEYMAPEILGRTIKKSTKHGLAVDWWAVGILTYEMMIGHTPFY
jgi:serine/threonine protein kinase